LLVNRAFSLIPIVVAAIVLAVTGWFHLFDPYRELFFATNHYATRFHIVMRLIFLTVLFQIQVSLGQFILNLFTRRGHEFFLACDEELAISFICGSAVLRTIMLGLGFVGLYSWWIMAPAGAVAAGLGSRRFLGLCARSVKGCAALWDGDRGDRVAIVGIGFAWLIAVVTIVVEKFLFPNGTGDYFSHYFPYYQLVVAHQNIWPNDVWYHFFISKANGDVFLSIILTDFLGPQTASCAMFFAGLLIMFCFVRRLTGDGLVATAASAATAIGFIWTFETAIGFTYWAEFPKEHVATATLLFGCVWATWRQGFMPRSELLPWAALVAVALLGLILFRVQFSPLVLLFLGSMAGLAWLTGKRELALSYAVPAAVVVISTAIILALNYSIMGLAEITPFRLFWSLSDQARFAERVSPFLMLLLSLGSSTNLGSISPPDLQQFPFVTLLAAVFRIDRALPLARPWGLPLAVALGAAVFATVRSSRPTGWRALVSASAAPVLILTAAVATFFVVNQIGSLYRIYMFCMFPVIVLASLPFAIARMTAGGFWHIAVGLVVAAELLYAVPHEIGNIPADTRHLEEAFALGRASIADALASQNAVWPPALEMSEVAGDKVPIWTSDVGFHFCVAPACDFESFFSFSMGPDWATIMFEPPDVARAALQRIGLNFFAIETTSPFFDILPYSPLFAPAEIGKQFGEVWESDGTYLLTWKSPATRPLPNAFFEQYAQSVQSALRFADFPSLYSTLAKVYGRWKSAPKYPVRLDPDLPRPRGWQ